MVPYGISVPGGAPDVSEDSRRELRRKLGLPLDRPIILSVGWITAQQKRMDYLVDEVARLVSAVVAGVSPAKVKELQPARLPPQVRDQSIPFLVMLGAMDEHSKPVLDLARAKLGEENFTARSVPHDQVTNYYRAADLFALASLQEGFGRVFLEALIYGLPVIAHDHPVMRFVLGAEGIFGDLSKEGALAELISDTLWGRTQESAVRNQEAAIRRRESVRARFSWNVLARQYREMFFDCAAKRPRDN
jgi:glycosyltransferase involved in cell wall biosynthesis